MPGVLTGPLRIDCATACYIDNLVDLTAVFQEVRTPRGDVVRPTDIDAMLEVDGRFLFIEFKREREPDMPAGQRWALGRLAKLDGVTVLVVAQLGAAYRVKTMNTDGVTEGILSAGQLNAYVKKWSLGGMNA